ncbi:Cyclin [Penicillium alfredii]|uniref:Cyclin n=1 Tax=Penicillium alfredii TaxID=1506179 RepID=A0A9W9FL11_9EURO|nr:Cyclin [Penicillium alfredii]KAJ5102094.1 Cyclin [Penicillium alfredii]
MDAKPQRIRVRGDENVPPSLPANKAIHHRNKSTPALSLAHNGANNGGRQAFGDKSNHKDAIQVSRDDCVLLSKSNQLESKPGLSQPAQRPMSMSGLKGLLSNVTIKPNPAGKAQPQKNKRSNEVYKDLPPVAEKEPSEEVKPTETSGPATAPIEEDTALKEEAIVLKEAPEQEESIAPTASVVDAYTSNTTSHAARFPLSPPPEPVPPPQPAHDEGHEDSEGEDEYEMSQPTHIEKNGRIMTVLYPRMTVLTKRELFQARKLVNVVRTREDVEEELWDTSLVSEYTNEIFLHLRNTEIKLLPVYNYMAKQTEIEWPMRSLLMDWLVQVHYDFALLPETLYLTVNYIDRFLSHKIVSMGKLQLVGATALFIAAKYEEVTAPSAADILMMVDSGYTVDELLKAEWFMLNILKFDLGWPGPMSFLRRISKADDYDLETRTMAKYFLEVAIMDERFICTPPSFLAASAHCLARLMLFKGPWTPEHALYSGYLYAQLMPVIRALLDCCQDPNTHHGVVYAKYCEPRFDCVAHFVEDKLDTGFYLPPQTELSDPARLDRLANY